MTTLDNLRLSAKRWLRALRAGDADARARFDRAYPQGPAAPVLRDVQHALARERGHDNWKTMIASGTNRPAAPDLRDLMGGRTHAERVATFLSFACWDHHVHGKGDHRMHDRAAGRLLSEHPELARDSLYTAIVCGDLEYVERAIAERPEAARERGGPRAWTPMLYVAYTRFTHDATLRNAIAIARLLLDRGADPNDFYQAGDARYTVLTGAAGEGEQDAPRQPYAAELFDLLLARGAEPFDTQVLYNTHFSGDVLWWLELVYAHTIDTARGTAWQDPDWRMFDMGAYGSGARFLLQVALDKRDLRLAEWLLARGANPNAAPGRDRRLSKRSVYEDAVREAFPELAELLAKYGATVTAPALTEAEAFVAAAFHLDPARAASLAAAHPEFLTSPDAMFAAAKTDRPDVMALLADLGVSVDVADESNTRPLHQAAVVNALGAARFLVDHGAEIDPVETRYGSTPLGWAAHADHRAMLDYLSRYSRDIWRLCFRGYVDRLREVLEGNPELARVTDDDGITPLWWLPDDEEKAQEIVDLLIAHGADPAARSRRGTTAAEWALKRGMREVAAKLIAEGPVESRVPRTDLDRAAYLAEDLTLAFDSGDPAALQRLSDHYRRTITWDDLKATVWKRVRTVREAKGRAGSFPVADARNIVAREAGFSSWDEFARAHQENAAPARAPYVIDAKENRIRPRRALTAEDWDTIASVMKERGITSLDAGDQMSDAAMEQISRLEHVTSLHIGASQQLTDAGLRCLARMPQLEELDLSNYPGGSITDRGLEVLRGLHALRRFQMTWQRGISDAGAAHLAACERLEVVNLLGTQTGDGAVRALAGKPHLRRFTTGRQVTDAGVALLPEFPLFRTWRGGDLQYSLMSFEAGPTHLMLDGPFTNRSLDALVTLDGLFGLSFFWHTSELTPDGLAPLASMSRLGFVGVDGRLCDDVAMRHIAAIPGLRMLMGQGAVASDEGFITLSRSRTLEYVWGRECPNLTGRGFAAFADAPALRGLAVSCKRVDDEALAMLPRFGALRELMPMDVSDEGFRHVGRCADLEGLWCMYCRDTTDRATSHLTDLARLKTYYAGATQITDRSLELLGGMPSLERIELYECKGVSDAGLRHLAALPRLREINLDGLPNVTLAGTAVFPARVRVNYSI